MSLSRRKPIKQCIYLDNYVLITITCIWIGGFVFCHTGDFLGGIGGAYCPGEFCPGVVCHDTEYVGSSD